MADKKKILVIDDDQDIINSITAVLKSNNFDVTAAFSAKEGIDAVSKIKPDLVLCDMMMEKIDSGSRVASEIRKSDDNVPIYLMSSIGAATAANVEISKLGFNGVLQKPVSPELLVDTINSALNQ